VTITLRSPDRRSGDQNPLRSLLSSCTPDLV
jgi:hypothetical protein